MIRHILRLTGALLLALLLAACWGEPQYPSQLVEADSLLMQGEYERADSVLHGCAPRNGERHAVSKGLKKAHALKAAKGPNPNPLFTVADTPQPVISNEASLNKVTLPKTYLYDLPTEAGCLYEF